MSAATIVKFKVEFLSREIPADPRVDTLRAWCVCFNEKGLTPQREGEGRSLGNLSFRLRPEEPEFVITGSTLSSKQDLAPSDFVTVVRSDRETRTVYVRGARDPSSESMLHFAIYSRRGDVEAIFHGHDKEITAAAAGLGLPETRREEPFGTTELLAQVLDILGDEDFLVMKNHGFLSFGRTMEEAGRRALTVKNRIHQRSGQ